MSSSGAIRIAVEGCGHGKLDTIYTSVQKSCEIKGWDGVDLVIIGGDFQAVRTHQDLNVTAMPHKYRRMGDFHDYYHGTKIAPYLTILIGGNHEASNHLFELYYGGWVAPNIYYLGAANVLQLGGLKIAALSGIWAGYDYRKPHFERLPYNDDTMRSIYHQRELDVRKLLAYRTQVDVGLSHDWPHEIWKHGDFQQLFRYKSMFRGDAEVGKLGSKAATYVLDRLRPPYWFSAHLHCKYVAYKSHDIVSEEKAQEALSQMSLQSTTNQAQLPIQMPKQEGDMVQQQVPQPNGRDASNDVAGTAHVYGISAWSNFSNTAQEEDAQIQEPEEGAHTEETAQNDRRTTAKYEFQETFKPVTIAEVDGALDRQSKPVSKIVPPIPQYDGTCFSTPKRRRNSSPSDEAQQPARPRISGQLDGSAPPTTMITNPDAIDVDLSDSEDDSSTKPILPKGTSQTSVQCFRHPASGRRLYQPYQKLISPARSSPKMGSIREMRSQETVGLRIEHSSSLSDASLVPFVLVPNKNADIGLEDSSKPVRNPDASEDTSLESAQEEDISSKQNHLVPKTDDAVRETSAISQAGQVPKQEQQPKATTDTSDVPEHLRAELEGRSSVFAAKEEVERTAALPFPEDITNKVTRFLALSKPEENRDREFLQLLEIVPSNTTINAAVLQRPLKLQYDPEWLAILRTFAPELQPGGSPDDRVPAHRGDTYYREKIVEEEEWIQKNVVDKQLLSVPENFVVTVENDQVQDQEPVDKNEMPREQTNPQTASFCELIEIENKFDFSEEDRDARMAAGAPASKGRGDGHRRGGRGGRGGGRGRGFGGRGRGGRGRGRGQW
ncbi:lariat debranching enzyme [Lithohypha guttulata]|uniref:Lariat debranching enzyme n=1 Tax=Lithohypha guttulata TaxID=1690604 RepID=A0AAN7T0A2_9EURO|nr:lariat debranching enzyme [Lithohypha guttulata]